MSKKLSLSLYKKMIRARGARDEWVMNEAQLFVEGVRSELASVVRSFTPINPDGDETEQAIAYALELAARAVERGTR